MCNSNQQRLGDELLTLSNEEQFNEATEQSMMEDSLHCVS